VRVRRRAGRQPCRRRVRRQAPASALFFFSASPARVRRRAGLPGVRAARRTAPAAARRRGVLAPRRRDGDARRGRRRRRRRRRGAHEQRQAGRERALALLVARVLARAQRRHLRPARCWAWARNPATSPGRRVLSARSGRRANQVRSHNLSKTAPVASRHDCMKIKATSGRVIFQPEFLQCGG